MGECFSPSELRGATEKHSRVRTRRWNERKYFQPSALSQQLPKPKLHQRQSIIPKIHIIAIDKNSR
jgi:hypothetical protein